jgi:hypothetical protein
VFHNHHPREK